MNINNAGDKKKKRKTVIKYKCGTTKGKPTVYSYLFLYSDYVDISFIL